MNKKENWVYWNKKNFKLDSTPMSEHEFKLCTGDWNWCSDYQGRLLHISM